MSKKNSSADDTEQVEEWAKTVAAWISAERDGRFSTFVADCGDADKLHDMLKAVEADRVIESRPTEPIGIAGFEYLTKKGNTTRPRDLLFFAVTAAVDANDTKAKRSAKPAQNNPAPAAAPAASSPAAPPSN